MCRSEILWRLSFPTGYVGEFSTWFLNVIWHWYTVYPKKYAHGFCFAVLCCGYTLTDFPISIRPTSLALWQSNDCPRASKATLMNMDKNFMWIHYERLHNHNKAKHNKTVCIFLGIYCIQRIFPIKNTNFGIDGNWWGYYDMASDLVGSKLPVNEPTLRNPWKWTWILFGYFGNLTQYLSDECICNLRQVIAISHGRKCRISEYQNIYATPLQNPPQSGSLTLTDRKIIFHSHAVVS